MPTYLTSYGNLYQNYSQSSPHVKSEFWEKVEKNCRQFDRIKKTKIITAQTKKCAAAQPKSLIYDAYFLSVSLKNLHSKIA